MTSLEQKTNVQECADYQDSQSRIARIQNTENTYRKATEWSSGDDQF